MLLAFCSTICFWLRPLVTKARIRFISFTVEKVCVQQEFIPPAVGSFPSAALRSLAYLFVGALTPWHHYHRGFVV